MDNFPLHRNSPEDYECTQLPTMFGQKSRPIDRIEILTGSDEEKDIKYETQGLEICSSLPSGKVFPPPVHFPIPTQDLAESSPPHSAVFTSDTEANAPASISEAECDDLVKECFSQDPLYREVQELKGKVSQPKSQTHTGSSCHQITQHPRNVVREKTQHSLPTGPLPLPDRSSIPIPIRVPLLRTCTERRPLHRKRVFPRSARDGRGHRIRQQTLHIRRSQPSSPRRLAIDARPINLARSLHGSVPKGAAEWEGVWGDAA